jgi:xanthine dehydrogenase YagR molybdenum-binding subunit
MPRRGHGWCRCGAGFPLPYIYQVATADAPHKDVYINAGQQRPMRAPGHPQGSFLTEILMDELADKVNMDPIEFRIKNLPPQGAQTRCGDSYLREGAAELGWDKRHPTGDKAPGPIKTGMGVAICTWGGGGRGPAQAHCEIASDGSVIMRSARRTSARARARSVAIVTAESLGSRPSQVTPRSATRSTA